MNHVWGVTKHMRSGDGGACGSKGPIGAWGWGFARDAITIAVVIADGAWGRILGKRELKMTDLHVEAVVKCKIHKP